MLSGIRNNISFKATYKYEGGDWLYRSLSEKLNKEGFKGQFTIMTLGKDLFVKCDKDEERFGQICKKMPTSNIEQVDDLPKAAYSKIVVDGIET